jgi:hypothetical protein
VDLTRARWCARCVRRWHAAWMLGLRDHLSARPMHSGGCRSRFARPFIEPYQGAGL